MNNSVTTKPVAIVLGGAISHIPLIIKLKEKGYYVILIDYLENPPAKSVADIHIIESTLEKEKVCEIAYNYCAKFVINAGLDQPIQTVGFVSDKLALPAPYNYQTAKTLTNKGLMKKVMWENKLPTGQYFLVDRKNQFDLPLLPYPVIIKPVDSTGSQGIKKAFCDQDYHKYVEEAIKISLTNKAIVEELYEGIELSIDCFVSSSVANILMIRQKQTHVDPKSQTIITPGTISPAEISSKTFKNIEVVANRIAHAFDLKNTPLLVQVFVNKKKLFLVEIAARIGGGTHSKNILINTGFDILEATLNCYTNINNSISGHIYASGFSASNVIYAKGGVFDSITGFKQLKEKGIIEDYFIYKSKGSLIPTTISSRNRVGAFLVKAKSKNDLFEKIKLAVSSLDVLDDKGSSIMRKDIYLKN